MTADQIIEGILGKEGGYVDHPSDKGGPTRWGITQTTARAHGYTGDMRNLPRETAKQILLSDYWTGPRFDQVASLSTLLADELCDTGVNMGPSVASKFFQRWLAGRAISRSSTRVAKETKVKRKLVMQRAKLKRASPKKPMATIRVNRGNLPAIKLGPVRVQLSRRKRDNGSSGSVLKIGNFSFPGAFVQQLNNGRWHVLRRTSKSRYPVEVVKVPLATPLTAAFKEELPKLMASDMPKEMMAAIKNQIRLVTK